MSTGSTTLEVETLLAIMDDRPTTLINELMMAAGAWAQLANADIPGLPPEAQQQVYRDRMACSERLRQRAAWVRELGQRLNSCPAEKCGQCTLYGLLTGPDIPAAETAPTETPTKEMTDGNQK